MDELARRYVWWKPPAQTLERPAYLLCQLMQLGTYDDVRAAMTVVGEAAFREALDTAPPGVLDERSWNFWHLRLHGQPPPPMPTRQVA